MVKNERKIRRRVGKKSLRTITVGKNSADAYLFPLVIYSESGAY